MPQLTLRKILMMQKKKYDLCLPSQKICIYYFLGNVPRQTTQLGKKIIVYSLFFQLHSKFVFSNNKRPGKTLTQEAFAESCHVQTIRTVTKNFMSSKISCQFIPKQRPANVEKSVLNSSGLNLKRSSSTISTF